MRSGFGEFIQNRTPKSMPLLVALVVATALVPLALSGNTFLVVSILCGSVFVIAVAAGIPSWLLLVGGCLAIPLGEAFALPQGLGGLPVLYSELLFLGSILLSALGPSNSPRQVRVAVVGLILWSTVATAFANDVYLSLAALKTVTLASLSLLVVLNQRPEGTSSEKIGGRLLLAGAVLGPVLSLQLALALAGSGESLAMVVATKSLALDTGASNYLAAIIVLSAAMGIAAMHLTGSKRLTMLMLIALAIDLFGVVVTGSRTQLFVLLVGIPLFWIFGGDKHKGRGTRQGSAFIMVGAVSVGVWYLLPLIRITWLPALQGGVTEYSTFEQRQILWSRALELYLNNPILGLGLHNFTDRYGAYAMTHNVILQVLVETGLVGLFFYILLIWRTVKIGGKGPHTKILVGLLLIVAVSGALEPTLRTRDYDYLFWIALGAVTISRPKVYHSDVETLNA